MPDFTAEQKRDAVQRELERRRRVFPNRVVTHRMRQAEANHQLAVMAAILADYAAAAERERLL